MSDCGPARGAAHPEAAERRRAGGGEAILRQQSGIERPLRENSPQPVGSARCLSLANGVQSSSA